MFGTIMRARVKPDQKDAFVQYMQQRPDTDDAEGFHSAEMAWEEKDPNRLVAIIRFRDRETYRANAAKAETDREYREMLKYLEAEPEWIDVNYGAYSGEPVQPNVPAVNR